MSFHHNRLVPVIIVVLVTISTGQAGILDLGEKNDHSFFKFTVHTPLIIAAVIKDCRLYQNPKGPTVSVLLILGPVGYVNAT